MAVLITATGPTALRTYVFPDANATMLTSASAVTPTQGGTGLTSYTTGDLLYASGAGTLAALADVAVGRVLVSGGVGVAPAWSATPALTSLSTTGALTASGALTANFNGGGGLVVNGVTPDAGVTGGSYMVFQTAGSNRWYMGMSANGNTGNFDLYNNIGASIVFSVNKTTSVMSMPTGASITGANGQAFGTLQSLTELTTIAAAATTDTAIQMPANSVVLAVSVRVTVVIPTAATFTVGDSGSAARFSTAAVSVAANSTDPGTKAGAYYNAGALSVRITPNLTPGANSGRVRVTIYYYTVTPPTS